MTDPFEHFGEQQRSYELLEEHRERLVADAIEVVAEYPHAQPVGLVMDSEASEVAQMRALFEQHTGQHVGAFVGIVPRKLVLDILRANAPHLLDFLEPESSGSSRMLPLVAITRRGYRLGAVAYEVPP